MGFILFLGIIGCLTYKSIQIKENDRQIKLLHEIIEEDDRARRTHTPNRILTGEYTSKY